MKVEIIMAVGVKNVVIWNIMLCIWSVGIDVSEELLPSSAGQKVSP
jgi:hypothetical protein